MFYQHYEEEAKAGSDRLDSLANFRASIRRIKDYTTTGTAGFFFPAKESAHAAGSPVRFVGWVEALHNLGERGVQQAP